MSPVALATWHTWRQKVSTWETGSKRSCNHLLEHDLVGTLDEVLPDRLSNVRVAMDEVICPENVHGRHIVNGSKLLGQARVPVKKFWMAANVIMSSLS